MGSACGHKEQNDPRMNLYGPILSEMDKHFSFLYNMWSAKKHNKLMNKVDAIMSLAVFNMKDELWANIHQRIKEDTVEEHSEPSGQ